MMKCLFFNYSLFRDKSFMVITIILKKRLGMYVIYLFFVFLFLLVMFICPLNLHVHCSLSAWMRARGCVIVCAYICWCARERFYTLKLSRYAVILAVWIRAWRCASVLLADVRCHVFYPFSILPFFLLWVEQFLFLLFCPPCPSFPPYGDRLAFRCNYLWNQKIVDK